MEALERVATSPTSELGQPHIVQGNRLHGHMKGDAEQILRREQRATIINHFTSRSKIHQ